MITGAARGLGRALAWQLAAAGARPILLARGEAAVAGAAEAIAAATGAKPEHHAVRIDDLGALEALGEAIGGGDVHAVVHGAAPFLTGPLEQADALEAAAALRVAVAAPLALTRALLPALRRAQGGRVLVVVSRVALPGEAAHPVASAAFAAAKHGQAGLAAALRAELAPAGIGVGALFPPDFDDVQPDEDAWHDDSGVRPTNRDVVEAALFALAARPRAFVDAIVTAQGAPL